MKKRKLKKMRHWWRKCRLATKTWKKLDLPKECREGPALQLRERLTLQEIPEERGSQGAIPKTGTKNWCFIICLSINEVSSGLKFVYSTLNCLFNIELFIQHCTKGNVLFCLAWPRLGYSQRQTLNLLSTTNHTNFEAHFQYAT